MGGTNTGGLVRNFLSLSKSCWASGVHCDEDISTTDITIPPILIQGPITRSRARQLKQQVNSFLCSSSCENENRLLPNDVLVLRNEGEGHGVLMEHQG